MPESFAKRVRSNSEQIRPVLMGHVVRQAGVEEWNQYRRIASAGCGEDAREKSRRGERESDDARLLAHPLEQSTHELVLTHHVVTGYVDSASGNGI